MSTNVNFTEAEIRQYHDIFLRWFRADKRAIPARTSQRVKDHARNFGFIKPGKHHRTLYVSSEGYHTALSLPVEVLWSFVKPLVEAHSGYSITHCTEWVSPLNFFKNDIGLIENALLKLDHAGYIDFFAQGSVWAISIH